MTTTITSEQVEVAGSAMLNALVADTLQSDEMRVPLYFSPATDWTDAWKLLHEGLVAWGNASVAWDMEDYGREPGDICWVQIGSCCVLGDFPIAVCQAWLYEHIRRQRFRRTEGDQR